MPKGPCMSVESVPSNSSDSSHNQSRNSRPTKRRFSMRSSRIMVRLPFHRSENGDLELLPRALGRLAQAEARREGVRSLGHELETEAALEELAHGGDGTGRLAEEAHHSLFERPREIDHPH